MNLKHYIREYPETLSQDVCTDIITRFENDVASQVKTYLPEHRSFTEINITAQPNWQDIHTMLLDSVDTMLRLYHHETGMHPKMWPGDYGYEQFRMKRYLPQSEDEFQFHVDVGDHSSARRFLVLFWYLNTVTVGGETTFQQSPADGPWYVVRAQARTLLMFPPMWTYPHVGQKPVSGPKYIVGTYLHYI